MRTLMVRRITLERFKLALDLRSNRRLYCFAWGRLVVVWEGKKPIPNEFVDIANIVPNPEFFAK